MMKFLILLIGCLSLFIGLVVPQEVIITDFPVGVGGSIGADFFKPYYEGLKALSDTLHRYPLIRAIITGGADGIQYGENNDAHNPALALGRAHLLRDYLLNEFKIDSTQLVIQSEDVKQIGPYYRYVAVRVDWELAKLDDRLAAVENRPPVEKHFTEVKEITNGIAENLGLQFSLGISTSPFGGIPSAASAISWKQFLYVEGIVGHTFWNNSFRYQSVDLDTKRRLIGGYVIFFPRENLPVGILGGWIRIEEISQEYYEYVRLSDGPMLGLRVLPFEFLSITGAYNPSRHRTAGINKSEPKNGQFMLSAAAHIAFGGKK